jgi:hypothetical protein
LGLEFRNFARQEWQEAIYLSPQNSFFSFANNRLQIPVDPAETSRAAAGIWGWLAFALLRGWKSATTSLIENTLCLVPPF